MRDLFNPLVIVVSLFMIVMFAAGVPGVGWWGQFVQPDSLAGWAQAVVTAVAGYIALQTLNEIRVEVKATKTAAKAAQAGVEAASDTLATNKQIELAYIAMSHKEPGYVRDEAGRTVIGVAAMLNITNFGRTPGHIVGGFHGWILGSTPDLAKLFGGAPLNTTAFLVPSALIDFYVSVTVPDSIADVISTHPTMRLWLVGEVHYRDNFGTLHCGGYGRAWSDAVFNLVYDRSTNPLNYDRPLAAEEIARRGYEKQ